MEKNRRKTIVTQLKNAICKSGLTHYRIAKDAGISPSQIDRFMTAAGDLRFATAAKIAGALGLTLKSETDIERQVNHGSQIDRLLTLKSETDIERQVNHGSQIDRLLILKSETDIERQVNRG